MAVGDPGGATDRLLSAYRRVAIDQPGLYRLATTGRMVSPGLFEMLVLLGRDRVVARLDVLITKL